MWANDRSNNPCYGVEFIMLYNFIGRLNFENSTLPSLGVRVIFKYKNNSVTIVVGHLSVC